MAQLGNICHVTSCLALKSLEELPVSVAPDPSFAHPLCEVRKPHFGTQFAAVCAYGLALR